MIYVTGDTHCPIDISKLSTDRWPEQRTLTKDDYLIICGDFGAVWDGSLKDRYWLDWFDKKPCTTLFVDGNHENHAMLDALPEERWKGGMVHRLRPSVLHLLRGQVFDLDGVSLFAMGGASSHDKQYRQENISWWARELPNDLEYCVAMENLEQHDFKVDLVITHCAPDSIQAAIASWYQRDKLTNFLEQVVLCDLTYDHWYFGHYHTDLDIDHRHTCLYQQVRAYGPAKA